MAMAACSACHREVQENIQECPHCGVIFAKWKPHLKPPAPKKFLVLKIFLMILAVVFAWGALLSAPLIKLGQNQEPKKPSPEATKRFEDCREKLVRSQELEVLYNLELKRAAPKVVVGPTFYTMPFDAKQGFAETINCFLMQGEPKYIVFDLLDWRTEKRVARYTLGTLKMD